MALSKNAKLYIGCIVVVVALCIGTLALVNGEFGGSDDAGGGVAEDYGYQPWCQDLFATFNFELPGETESLLFAVQAAIGAFLIGYFVGKNSKKKEENIEKDKDIKE